MASLNEAFAFPLTSTAVSDMENTKLNVPGRGSYIPLDKNTNSYKPKKSQNVSDLKMYNTKKSLKEDNAV